MAKVGTEFLHPRRRNRGGTNCAPPHMMSCLRGFRGETFMQRVTITLDDDLMADLDRIIAARGYQNGSEAIRDLARAGIQQAASETGSSGQCVAALVYVYDHAARELSKRLVQNFHGHHEMSLATLHVHLDNDSCMEVTVLKGA